MASAEPRKTALLFPFSAALLLLLLARELLLQPQPPQWRLRGTLADLLQAALDRFFDGRSSLLDLATRRNMILLCHAILLLILRDAGVLSAPPARRRGAGPSATTAAVGGAASDAEGSACSVPPRPRPCRSVFVWRRPRNRAAAMHDATGRLGGRQRLPAAAQAEAEPAATKQIVLVHKATRDQHHLDDHDRSAVVELEHQAAASATDAKSDLDRRVIIADDGRNANAAEEETVQVLELADDRSFDEFIAKQRSMMRQESLQLVRTGSQAIAAC